MANTASFRNLATLIVCAALMLAGCTKEQAEELHPVTELTMDYPAIPFTIHGSDATGQYVAMTLDFDAQALGQLLAANHYTLAQVKDFRFTKAQLHLTSPANGNYNAFRSATLQLVMGDNAPGTVASMDPVPDWSHTLLMQLGNVNLADLVRSGNVHLVAKVQLDGPLPEVSGHSLALSAKMTLQL